MAYHLAKREGREHWYVRGTIGGRTFSRSTETADKAIAEQYRVKWESEAHRAAIYGPAAVTTFEKALTSYVAVTRPAAGQVALLNRLAAHLAPVLLVDIRQDTVDEVAAKLCRPDAAPATVLRNVVGPLRAVINHAARRGWCQPANFETPAKASGVKRTRWLTPEEYERLEAAAAPHLRPLLAFLVGTGVRLSEALELQWKHVNLAHSYATVWEKQGRERTVQLPPAARAALMPLRAAAADLLGTERVFLTPSGKPYEDNGRTRGGQIAAAWEGACRRAGIEDATPHTLRHTWATWQYAMHRDLMRLREEGGWSSVVLVERYAKLAPAGMVPAMRAVWGTEA